MSIIPESHPDAAGRHGDGDRDSQAGAGADDRLAGLLVSLEKALMKIFTGGGNRQGRISLARLQAASDQSEFSRLEVAAVILELQTESRLEILTGREVELTIDELWPECEDRAFSLVPAAADPALVRGSAPAGIIVPASLWLTSAVYYAFRDIKNQDFGRVALSRLMPALNGIVRHPKTGLVALPGFELDDETANYFFLPSLLFAQGCHQVADLLHEQFREGEADQWRYRAQQIEKYIRIYFWNKRKSMFRVCRTGPPDWVDVHASALSVYRHNSTSGQLMSIARAFNDDFACLTAGGAVRRYWTGSRTSPGAKSHPEPMDETADCDLSAAGWFAYTLDFMAPRLADQVVFEATGNVAARLSRINLADAVQGRQEVADIIAASRLVAALYHILNRRRIRARRFSTQP